MLAGRIPCIVAEPCSPMRLLSHSRTASSSSNTTTSTTSPWLGPSTLYARHWQHRRVLSSPMRCWDWQTQPTPRRIGGLTASTSASTLPFLPRLPRLRRRLSSTSTTALTALTSASPPFHDDCLDASPSSSWRPSRACSSIDMAIRPQLRRPRPSSARLLRPRLLRPHARLPRHRHKGLPPCMRTHRLLLQPHHMRRIDCYDCRGC